MPIDNNKTKSMPIPSYRVAVNTAIEDKVMGKQVPDPLASVATGELTKVVSDPYTIQRKVSDSPRTVSDVNKGIMEVSPVSVYVEPRIPDVFPSKVDYIKSLEFSTNNLSAGAKANLSEYYNLVLQLMNGKIEVNEYYAKMPTLIEGIKNVVLTETDWENLRDAVLRTQNYIVNYLWTDMQNISKKMDEGFALYQASINKWIDEANNYYNSDDFIPKDAVKLQHLSNTNNGDDRHELAQNMWDVMNSMGTRISSEKNQQPPTLQYKQAGVANEKDFPQDKGLVWIELV